MPISKEEWEEGEPEKGGIEAVYDLLEEEYPKAYDSYEIYSNATSGIEIYRDGERGHSRTDVMTLLYVLIDSGRVESKTVGGEVYYRAVMN